MNAVVDLHRIHQSPLSQVGQTQVDLSAFSEEQRSEIRLAVAEFHLSVGRLANEYFYMTQQVARLHQILGDQFSEFVVSELKISLKTAKRYLYNHTVLQAHFSTAGMIDVTQAKLITQNALRLLSPDTDEGVITEIKALADQGAKVDEAAVRRILDARETELQAELDSVKAEKELTEKELVAQRTQHEVQSARFQRESQRQEELLRRAEAQRTALEEEIRELQGKETIVNEVTKEVLPAGYSSAVEATNAMNTLLAEAQEKKKKVEDEIAAIKQKSEALQREMSEMQGGAQEFLKLKGQLDEIIAKYPQARLQAMSDIDPNIKNMMKGIGEAMVLLGKQLSDSTQ